MCFIMHIIPFIIGPQTWNQTYSFYNELMYFLYCTGTFFYQIDIQAMIIVITWMWEKQEFWNKVVTCSFLGFCVRVCVLWWGG